MNRRAFLTTVGSGSLALTAGCSSLLEDPGAFHFGITNWRERTYTADLTLHKNAEETLIDGRFDIAANGPDRDDPPGVYLESVTQVKNGDVIDARVRLDGEEYRGSYEVTCNRREGSENNFFLYIHSPGGGDIEFGGSECGV
ncbi:hypothetical protein HWV23_07495 [Natronomonas halophila]|uniref:hypothetical protein n=1 Tax=Natronomonas halophila TaxID=2747817 RepID=UPI0015B4F4C6|nr:hypothetical protein [Natronomonas halophila]QLD85574.1 hypothetical protein HWV23_07495 [Natronomonas halophila]